MHAFSSNLSSLSLSSWKMHEATTINSFRHFLDNRETFNRGEGARRRKGVGIEALCAHRIPLWSLAALYHRRHLEKRFPFERANTFSVEGGEVAFLERTQRFPWKSLSIVARSPRFLPSRRASKECGLIERWTTSMNFIPKEERGWRLRRSILNLSRNEVGANYPTCLSRISAHSNFFWTKLLLLLTTVYNGYVKRIAATIHPALLTWRTEGRADRSNATEDKSQATDVALRNVEIASTPVKKICWSAHKSEKFEMERDGIHPRTTPPRRNHETLVNNSACSPIKQLYPVSAKLFPPRREPCRAKSLVSRDTRSFPLCVSNIIYTSLDSSI